jgi:uncharacterized protein
MTAGPRDPFPRDAGTEAVDIESLAGQDPVVEELTPDRAWQLLRDAPIGRLAVVLADQPEIFPVNHVVDHGTIVFRTADGTKLLAADGHAVAFETDGTDPGTGQVWSVVAKGRARHVRRMQDVIGILDLQVLAWQRGRKPRFVRIEVDEITGRRFSPAR